MPAEAIGEIILNIGLLVGGGVALSYGFNWQVGLGVSLLVFYLGSRPSNQ